MFTQREISKPGREACFYLANFDTLVVLMVVYVGMTLN